MKSTEGLYSTFSLMTITVDNVRLLDSNKEGKVTHNTNTLSLKENVIVLHFGKHLVLTFSLFFKQL